LLWGKNTFLKLINKKQKLFTFVMMKLLKIFFLSAGLISVFSCKKDSTQTDIPNTLVDYYVYLSQPQYSSLNTVGNWMYISAGVRGIVVYHRAPDEFIALERNCTYQSGNSNAIVSVDSTNVFLHDTSCGSKFYITDGSVANAPATVPLKQYHASYNASSQTVHIYN
jgi:nitrite reductase/ring-hydroxylating ferredoxin subunit